jgi:4-hydroxybenzoate polyprenyltransferase
MASIKQILFLLRISQWSKAAFVLLGVFYSGSLSYLPNALLAAIVFCLVASGVYIYNDLQDIKGDQLHPQKHLRPLASGNISINFAVSMLALLLLSGLSLAWFVSTNLLALLSLYLLINLAYNFVLRNLPVVDVLCITSGFMLRVLAGTIGIGLAISWWLTLTATLISLLIALCKRRLEKQLDLHYATRAVLQKYSFQLLDSLIIGTAISCFIAYFLYTIYVRDRSFYFQLTLPFAAIGLWRFIEVTIHNSSDNDDPVSLFLSDSPSQINLFCFLLLTLAAIYRI